MSETTEPEGAPTFAAGDRVKLRRRPGVLVGAWGWAVQLDDVEGQVPAREWELRPVAAPVSVSETENCKHSTWTATVRPQHAEARCADCRLLIGFDPRNYDFAPPFGIPVAAPVETTETLTCTDCGRDIPESERVLARAGIPEWSSEAYCHFHRSVAAPGEPATELTANECMHLAEYVIGQNSKKACVIECLMCGEMRVDDSMVPFPNRSEADEIRARAIEECVTTAESAAHPHKDFGMNDVAAISAFFMRAAIVSAISALLPDAVAAVLEPIPTEETQ